MDQFIEQSQIGGEMGMDTGRIDLDLVTCPYASPQAMESYRRLNTEAAAEHEGEVHAEHDTSG
jgi:hypothetical protein